MRQLSKKLTWFGHNCFLFEFEKTKFLIDPFLVEGISPVSAHNIFADYILVSHGHSDHCANAVSIAQNNNSTILAIAEVAEYFGQKRIKTEPVNIGGTVYLSLSNSNSPQMQVLAVQAPHSSTMPDGSSGGNSLGFILSFSQNGLTLSPDSAPLKPMKNMLANANAFSIYFACDSGLFAEMSWIGELGIDLAVLPIGGRYTMGPALSLDAVNMLKPRYVVPSHYNTWKPIIQNATSWSESILQYTKSTPLVLMPGKTIEEKEDCSWS